MITPSNVRIVAQFSVWFLLRGGANLTGKPRGASPRVVKHRFGPLQVRIVDRHEVWFMQGEAICWIPLDKLVDAPQHVTAALYREGITEIGSNVLEWIRNQT